MLKVTMEASTKEWNQELGRFIKESGKDADTVTRKFALQLQRLIIQKTPVDTGRARAGWIFEKIKDGFYRIVNRVKYIVPLEFGHSKQAPAGMVRLSMFEMTRGKDNLPKQILEAYRARFKGKTVLRATR